MGIIEDNDILNECYREQEETGRFINWKTKGTTEEQRRHWACEDRRQRILDKYKGVLARLNIIQNVDSNGVEDFMQFAAEVMKNEKS